MAVPDSFRDRVMGDLAPLGDVRVRAMFGGYVIFEDGTVFVLPEHLARIAPAQEDADLGVASGPGEQAPGTDSSA